MLTALLVFACGCADVKEVAPSLRILSNGTDELNYRPGAEDGEGLVPFALEKKASPIIGRLPALLL